MKPISLDDITTSTIPAEHKAEIPTVNEQLGGLNKLNGLHQATDLVAPVTGLLPSVSQGSRPPAGQSESGHRKAGAEKRGQPGHRLGPTGP
ncbi:hypothetical protein [Streptomyces sp. NPDC055400]